MRKKLGLGFGSVEVDTTDPYDLDVLCERKTDVKPMDALLTRLESRRPVEEQIRGGPFAKDQHHQDGSGNFRVVDRDTAQMLKSGLPNRESARRWAIRNNLVPLSDSEQTQVERADPVATAIMREHPDTVLVGRF